MGEGLHSVLSRELVAEPWRIARVIAGVTGQVAFDVIRKLRDSIGVLATALSERDAERLVGTLSTAGVRAFALAETEFVRFPDPVFLETARLGEDALEVSDLRDAANRRVGSVKVPYRDMILLATALVRTRIEKKVPDMNDPLNPAWKQGASITFDTGGSVNAAYQFVMEPRTHTKWTSDHFLDIFAVEPAHHLRLNASTFNFIQTGFRMEPSSITNLISFIRHLAPNCDPGAADPSIRDILDGNPQTNLRFGSAAQYDAYLSWRIQLLYHAE